MAELEFSDIELKALRKEYAASATDEQFEIWIADCKRRGLVPMRDVVLQIRRVSRFDAEAQAKVWEKKAIYITTIGAFRKIAERTGRYAGQLPSKWIYLDDKGAPTIESDIPLPEPGSTARAREPWAVKVSLLRKGFDAPMTVPARFNAYAQTFKQGGKEVLTGVWSDRGPEQLEKCAEALAFRKAFPEEFTGLYLAEEIKDEPDEGVSVNGRPADSKPADGGSIPPAPATPPAVDHTPAEGKNEPRPGEKKKEKRASKRSTGTMKAVEDVTHETLRKTEEQVKPSPPPAQEPTDGTALPPEPQTDLEREFEGQEMADRAYQNRVPTAEEKKGFVERIRKHAATLEKNDVNRDALKTYIEKVAKNTVTNLTWGQWTLVLQKLDAAVDEKDLASIVKGK